MITSHTSLYKYSMLVVQVDNKANIKKQEDLKYVLTRSKTHKVGVIVIIRMYNHIRSCLVN